MDFEITNSLFSRDLDALKMDAPEDPLTSVVSADKINMEENYFSQGIKFLNYFNEQDTANKLTLYNKIMNMNKPTSASVLEGYADYYVQVEAIISKFLQFVDVKLKDFLETMRIYINEENSIITKYRKDFNDIKNYDDSGLEGYKYTIDESIPDFSAVDAFNASFFDDLFKPVITDLNAQSVAKTVSSIELEEDYKKFRATIINEDRPLSENEFVRYLFRVYRNKSDGFVELDVNEKTIKDIAEDWFNFNNYKNMLIRQQTQMSRAYEGVLKKISTVCKNNNGLTISAFSNLLPADVRSDLKNIDGKAIDNAGAMMSADMMYQLDIYCRAKCDQIKEYTNITCMAFMAKLDAIKAMYEQNRNLLLRCVESLAKPEVYGDIKKKAIEDADKEKED